MKSWLGPFGRSANNRNPFKTIAVCFISADRLETIAENEARTLDGDGTGRDRCGFSNCAYALSSEYPHQFRCVIDWIHHLSHTIDRHLYFLKLFARPLCKLHGINNTFACLNDVTSQGWTDQIKPICKRLLNVFANGFCGRNSVFYFWALGRCWHEVGRALAVNVA